MMSVCAAAPQAQPVSADQPPGEAPASVPASVPDIVPAKVPAGPATASPAQALPNVALSSDLLYKLTKAELEFKQGQWQGPYITMMVTAQQTRDPRLAQRAAEMALAAKQGGEALAAIRLWRELAPNSDEANQYFLGFVVLTDDILETEPVFAQRLKDAKPAALPAAMFQTQQFLSRAKDKLMAFSILERLMAPYGATAEAHMVISQGAFSIGERDRAVREAQKALELKPDSELAVLSLAQVMDDADAIGKQLSAFLDKNPGALEVRSAYARLLVEQKQFEAGRQQFLLLQKAQPDNIVTMYALGIISLQLNDNAVAENYFKQFLAVLAANPDDDRDPSKVLMILSQMAEERGDVKGAIQWLDKIDGREPRAYYDARLRRAQLIARNGDLDGARKALAEIRSDDVNDQAQILLVDAQLLRDGGYTQTAFTVLDNALKRFPDSNELLYDHALAAEKLGRTDVMEASLRKVIAQAPDNQHAYNALGYSLAERNVRLPEAYALVEKALSIAPNDPFIMDSMGWVHFRLGQLGEAENLLRRAYALRSDPEIAVHLGEVLWQKGEKEDAQALWRAARAKDPGNDALKSTLARLNLSL
ncbi:tetratricopeptide repeat protein [Janthinobacterium agaricidamnosum]